jgi:hypothetical protein
VARDLYLHEIVDIVGAGTWPYMDLTAAATLEERPGFELLGSFATMGVTGRWPQVVNLWEIPGGYEGWRACVEALGLRRRGNPSLASWWARALPHRSGGFDRLLAAAPGTPDAASLRAGGVRGSVFVHELSAVRPGAALEYLAAVREEWLPIAADYGLTPLGLFEVLMNDTEVCTIWAAEPDGPVRIAAAYDAARGLATGEVDPRIAAWRARASEFCTRWREELMTPHPATCVAPGDGV